MNGFIKLRKKLAFSWTKQTSSKCFSTKMDKSSGWIKKNKNEWIVHQWYFGTKIVLTYCVKKMFLWSRKTFEIRGWSLRIFNCFEITRTIYSNSERSEQFLIENNICSNWHFIWTRTIFFHSRSEQFSKQSTNYFYSTALFQENFFFYNRT